MFGEGTLEILPDGFGFLRSPDYHYLACPDDIYVSPSQIRRFGLRNGMSVADRFGRPKKRALFCACFVLKQLTGTILRISSNVIFDDLTPLHPDKEYKWRRLRKKLSTRIVDLIVPIGFGQRGLIVSPPRAGKTILMQKMAKAVFGKLSRGIRLYAPIDERPGGSH